MNSDIELVTGLTKSRQGYSSALQPKGFVASGRGMGHAVFTLGEQKLFNATRCFVQEAMGMQLSDWLEASVGPHHLHVSFCHCNPRHHSLAFAYFPIGAVLQKLHHIDFHVPNMDAVGLTCDRYPKANALMANTLGRYGNARLFSFYNITPGGWQVEIGSGGVEITEDYKAVAKWDCISDWGHQPPAAFGPQPGKLTRVF